MRIIRTVLLSAGLSLFAATAAQADTVVVVSTSFPVDSLGKADFARSFLGKPWTLPSGKPVKPINLKAGATREEMQNGLLEKNQAAVEKYWAKMAFTGNGTPPDEVGDDAEMLKRVAGDPTAIGYVDAKSVNSSVKVLKVQ
jgi:ABC-type phosphate transport system substrate-binding protein